MNAFADAWSAASNVRMWIGEAERSLRDARNGWSSGVLATLFTRGYA